MEGRNEGLCLEGNRLRHNFLFTVLKFSQDLWVNGTHRTVAETIIRNLGVVIRVVVTDWRARMGRGKSGISNW
jgi:hypothetical protein